MVSLKSSSIMLRELYLSLIASLDSIEPDTLEGAFSIWMCKDAKDFSDLNFPIDFAVTNYQDVAKLAFLTEVNPQLYGANDIQLIDGLNRVAGRSITMLNEEPAPFRNDAIALLGIALGAKRIGGELQARVSDWMKTFINPQNDVLPKWKRLFLVIAMHFADDAPIGQNLLKLSGIADLKFAFRSKGVDFDEIIDSDEAYHTLVEFSLSENAELPILACRLTTLSILTSNLPTISINRPTVEQLIEMLANVPSAFKRWPWENKAKTSTGVAQKWDLQNEYHVQSIIYFLLAPIFQDIEHEFYFEPTGQLNPRADIGLPTLNLIIEIKFLRKGKSFAKMIEEVAADASLYFKKDSVFLKKYSRMIVFLWDDSSRVQEYNEFKRGVCQLNNIVGCIVVPRPGDMLAME
jgi:hypothetical protein